MSELKKSEAYQITWLIRRLFRAMGQASNESLLDLNVSAADRATMEFLYPDRRLSVPQIAASYSVSRQHVQVTMNSLQHKKLVVQHHNPLHKKSSLFSLSPAGGRLFKTILKRDGLLIEQLFAATSEREKVATRNVLSQLLQSLQQGASV